MFEIGGGGSEVKYLKEGWEKKGTIGEPNIKN